MVRHKRDYASAGRHFQALFRGEDTPEADVGGIEFARVMDHLRVFVEGHLKKGR